MSMTFKSPEDADRFFEHMEAMSRQMAATLGEGSDAYEAVRTLEQEKAKGKDMVILFTENRWVIGPRPSWDMLGNIGDYS